STQLIRHPIRDGTPRTTVTTAFAPSDLPGDLQLRRPVCSRCLQSQWKRIPSLNPPSPANQWLQPRWCLLAMVDTARTRFDPTDLHGASPPRMQPLATMRQPSIRLRRMRRSPIRWLLPDQPLLVNPARWMLFPTKQPHPAPNSA